jgi:hypothetical protein
MPRPAIEAATTVARTFRSIVKAEKERLAKGRAGYNHNSKLRVDLARMMVVHVVLRSHRFGL